MNEHPSRSNRARQPNHPDWLMLLASIVMIGWIVLMR
jgi:hypothetical protein